MAMAMDMASYGYGPNVAIAIVAAVGCSQGLPWVRTYVCTFCKGDGGQQWYKNNKFSFPRSEHGQAQREIISLRAVPWQGRLREGVFQSARGRAVGREGLRKTRWVAAVVGGETLGFVSGR